MTQRFSQFCMQSVIFLTRLFPLWAILCAFIAYFLPDLFVPVKFQTSHLLMFVMFTMGVTLSFDDFKRVVTKPKAVIVCTLLHYLVMPITALLLSKLFTMRPELLVGMVLVGSVASGTASNVMIYLAKGNVALSVTISSVSTLVGVIVTPLLAYLLIVPRSPCRFGICFCILFRLYLCQLFSVLYVIISYCLLLKSVSVFCHYYQCYVYC